MVAIWKFPLEITDRQTVMMPAAADVLCVQAQHEIPCLWAVVDTEATPTPYEFRMVGIGHPIHDKLGPYIGTFQLRNGGLVFHLFEDDPEAAEVKL